MTEDDSMSRAGTWLLAARNRRDHTVASLEKDPPKAQADANAREAVIDGMSDRITVILALFPELREDQ